MAIEFCTETSLLRSAIRRSICPNSRLRFVIADVETRRHKIRKGLDAAARTVAGIRWREDHPLVDAVTHLTEWPSVLLGSFEEEYLTLPEEVLVTVMRDHQKYFALEDASGKLAPHFLTVLNTEADEGGLAVIRHGNERVLRSRFKDARFFWDFDQKIPLVDRVEMLKSVTFHEKSWHLLRQDQSKANHRRDAFADRARLFQGATVSIEAETLKAPCSCSKTDSTAELVKEFTELQGIIGGLYARLQGFGEGVCEAIYCAIQTGVRSATRFHKVEGRFVGLADRLQLDSCICFPSG